MLVPNITADPAMTVFEQAEDLFDAAERETHAANSMERAGRHFDAARHQQRARAFQLQANEILDRLIDNPPPCDRLVG
jgi:hypothetical protein